jgi:hypothetical protein
VKYVDKVILEIHPFKCKAILTLGFFLFDTTWISWASQKGIFFPFRIGVVVIA